MRPGLGQEIEAYLREADRICDLLGRRHMCAHRAEKQGHVEEAIQLYEQNVSDGDLSTLSYERLRILYLHRGRRSDALRVSEAYIQTLDELARLDPNLPLWATSNRKRFMEYAAELRR
jgi:tetratricopeptide (TPR) repeat protein